MVATIELGGDLEVGLDILREADQKEFKECSYVLRSSQGIGGPTYPYASEKALFFPVSQWKVCFDIA